MKKFNTVCFALFCFTCTNLFSQVFSPGEVYYDPTGFIEYRAGNLPIIISAPHGGSLEPDSIPDRDCSNCVVIKDAWTQQITEGLYDAIVEKTGCYPHVIINLLHRKKLDANRSIEDAADGNELVENAWANYHSLIDSAKQRIESNYGRGLFLDVHGHAHSIQRIELGYLLSRSELQQTDSVINSDGLNKESSIRTLIEDNLSSYSHSELLRGENSLGSLLHYKGFSSVPSFSIPYPENTEAYFEGGYNTIRHGSRDANGNIDAIQLELNQTIRFDSATRENLIDSMAQAILEYVDMHYYNQFIGNYCDLILGVDGTSIFGRNITVYPNPATSYVHLLHQPKGSEVFIYNHFGQLVLADTFEEEHIKIDFLSNGIYTIVFRKRGTPLGSTRFLKN